MMAKKTTGKFSTRQKLEEAVYLYSAGNGLDDTTVSRSCGVSSATINNILKSYKPSPENERDALNRKAIRLSNEGQNIDYLVDQIKALDEKIQINLEPSI